YHTPIPAKIDFVKAGESVKHVKPVESIKHVKPVKTAEQTENSKKFSSNRMTKKSLLPTNMRKGAVHRESRPVWNNVQRINHQNKFAPTAVFTRSGRMPVSAAKPKAAASTSAVKPVNTARPKKSVNFSKSRSTFHKSHSPIRRLKGAGGVVVGVVGYSREWFGVRKWGGKRVTDEWQEILCVTQYFESRDDREVSLRRVVPKNYNPKGERFLIASRFPTPPLACAFFIPGATVKSKKKSRLKKNKRLMLDIGRFPIVVMMTTIIILQSHPFYPPRSPLSIGDEHLDTILATESDEVIKSSVENLIPIPSEFEGIPDTMCDVHLVNNPTPFEAKDHFEIVINSNDDISCSDDDSLCNENIEYVEASPHNSELVSLGVAEIVIPEEEEIEDDNLREKLLNDHLLIANIEALKDNPTPSFEFLTKSSSTSPKSFLEETNTFHHSLPKFENFCFDLEEISSGSTTTHFDISLPDYKVFYFDDDHIKEISSGSTTTHF
nr:hypothetical protein [Tanacetum cinerariifolium]